MGVLEGKFSEISKEMSKEKGERAQQFGDVNKQLEGLGAQVCKMGSSFDEIKQLILGMQKKEE